MTFVCVGPAVELVVVDELLLVVVEVDVVVVVDLLVLEVVLEVLDELLDELLVATAGPHSYESTRLRRARNHPRETYAVRGLCTSSLPPLSLQIER